MLTHFQVQVSSSRLHLSYQIIKLNVRDNQNLDKSVMLLLDDILVCMSSPIRRIYSNHLYERKTRRANTPAHVFLDGL